jgi:hypothetical protein
MKYDIRDAVLVYYFINEWNKEYLYDRCDLEILIGDELVEWDWIRTVKIEEIFKKIIENDRISIRLIEEPNIKNKYNLDESDYTCERFKLYEKILDKKILSDWTDDNWKINNLESKFEKKYYKKNKYNKIKQKIWFLKINTPIRKIYYKYKIWKRK